MRESAKERKMLDRLTRLLRGTDPGRLRSALEKTETVQMRVTGTDKVSMAKTASALGLTITDYLTRLHLFAVELLAKDRKGAKR